MHGRSRRGNLPDLTRFDTQSFIYGSDDTPLCAAIVVRIATIITVFTTWFGRILLVRITLALLAMAQTTMMVFFGTRFNRVKVYHHFHSIFPFKRRIRPRNATVCPPEVDLPEICMHGLGIWLAIRGVVQESLYASKVIKSIHLQIPKVHFIPGYLMVSHGISSASFVEILHIPTISLYVV